MITKEEFINLVTNNWMRQKDDSFTYAYINDEYICPFCKQKLKTVRTDYGWKYICECEESVKFHNTIKSLENDISNLQEKISVEYNKVYPTVLNVFKEDFREKIDTIKEELFIEFNNTCTEILSL